MVVGCRLLLVVLLRVGRCVLFVCAMFVDCVCWNLLSVASGSLFALCCVRFAGSSSLFVVRCALIGAVCLGLLAIRWLFVVCCLLLCVACYLLLAVCWLLLVVLFCGVLFAVCCLLFAILCVLFVVRCSLCVGCCVLFA